MSSSFQTAAAAFALGLGLVACKSAPPPRPDATGAAPENVVEQDEASIGSEMPAPGQPGPGEEVVEFDYNNDRKPDLYKFYAEGTSPNSRRAAATKDGSAGDVVDRPLRSESDLNGDGRIDVWTWFSREGAVDRTSYDLDFDGHVDVVSFYEKGVVVRKEVFHGFREKPDTFKYFEKGKLNRIERDRNGDGRIDAWEYWEGEQIDRIGEDGDGDGVVDRWVKPKKAG